MWSDITDRDVKQMSHVHFLPRRLSLHPFLQKRPASGARRPQRRSLLCHLKVHCSLVAIHVCVRKRGKFANRLSRDIHAHDQIYARDHGRHRGGLLDPVQDLQLLGLRLAAITAESVRGRSSQGPHGQCLCLATPKPYHAKPEQHLRPSIVGGAGAQSHEGHKHEKPQHHHGQDDRAEARAGPCGIGVHARLGLVKAPLQPGQAHDADQDSLLGCPGLLL